MRAGLEALNVHFVVEEPYRLPQLNAVYVPEGVEDAAVRRRLLEEFHLEIGAGLGALAGKTWRIGLMDHTSQTENVLFCLQALDTVLTDSNANLNPGTAVQAAKSVYQEVK